MTRNQQNTVHIARSIALSTLLALFGLVVAIAPLAGCEGGTAEETGEEIDEAVEEVSDEIDDAVDG